MALWYCRFLGFSLKSRPPEDNFDHFWFFSSFFFAKFFHNIENTIVICFPSPWCLHFMTFDAPLPTPPPILCALSKRLPGTCTSLGSTLTPTPMATQRTTWHMHRPWSMPRFSEIGSRGARLQCSPNWLNFLNGLWQPWLPQQRVCASVWNVGKADHVTYYNFQQEGKTNGCFPSFFSDFLFGMTFFAFFWMISDEETSESWRDRFSLGGCYAFPFACAPPPRSERRWTEK